MEYIRQDYYKGLYGDISKEEFSRLSWEACRRLDVLTTGIDGVKKLKLFFPTDEDDAEAVKRCACKIVNILHQIEAAEASANAGRGYETTEQGIRGKVISSVSAGNESISYTTKAGAETAIDKAVSSVSSREKLLDGTIREYLSGVTDANGVNLLYMADYPRRFLKWTSV